MTIGTIIEELTSTTESLYGPLLKSKVLATRVNNSDLLTWVNKEIDGYKYREDELPPTRIVRCSTFCTIQQGYAREYNQPLPISFIPDEMRTEFQKFNLYESVMSLEVYVQKNDPAGQLSRTFPIDFSAVVTDEVRKRGGDFIISDIRMVTGVAEVIGAIVATRNKLLSLLLEIQVTTKTDLVIGLISESQASTINQTINYFMAENINNNSTTTNIDSSGKNTNIALNNSGDVKQSIEDNSTDLKFDEFISSLKELKDSLSDERQKEFLNTQVSVIEIEREKSSIEPSVIKEVLGKLEGFLWSIAANAYTQPVLEHIKLLAASLE